MTSSADPAGRAHASAADAHDTPGAPEFAPPGHSARDHAPQFVLPLVVRVERAAPPSRTDALESAARAVLVLLSDPRAAGEGEWAQAVRDWQDARIRKVVRRARGAEWGRAEALPGITVTGGPGHDGAAAAEVRVFPPVPLDGWPRDLAKLQVSGTELADPVPPPAPDRAGTVLWLNPGLEMSAGKAMAQAGHGAQLAWWALPDAERARWRADGFPLAVRTAAPGHWAELTALTTSITPTSEAGEAGQTGGGLPAVHDAGFTEVAPNSLTVIADHPALHPSPSPHS